MEKIDFEAQAKNINLPNDIKYRIINSREQLYLKFPPKYEFTVNDCKALLAGRFTVMNVYAQTAPGQGHLNVQVPPPYSPPPVIIRRPKKQKDGVSGILIGIVVIVVVVAVLAVFWKLNSTTQPIAPTESISSCPGAKSGIQLTFDNTQIQDKVGVFPVPMPAIKNDPSCIVFDESVMIQVYNQVLNLKNGEQSLQDYSGRKVLANLIMNTTAKELGKDPKIEKSWADEIYKKVFDALDPSRFQEAGGGKKFLILPSLTGTVDPIPTGPAPTSESESLETATPEPTQAQSSETSPPASTESASQATPSSVGNAVTFEQVSSILSQNKWESIGTVCPEKLTGVIPFNKYSKAEGSFFDGSISVDFTSFTGAPKYNQKDCLASSVGLKIASDKFDHSSDKRWAKIGDLWFFPTGCTLTSCDSSSSPSAPAIPSQVSIWELADIFKQLGLASIQTPCVAADGMRQVVDFKVVKVDFGSWQSAPYYTQDRCKRLGNGTIIIENQTHFGDKRWIQVGNLWVYPSGCTPSECSVPKIADRDLPRDLYAFVDAFKKTGASIAVSDGHDKVDWIMRYENVDGSKDYLVLNTVQFMPIACSTASKISIATTAVDTNFVFLDNVGVWSKCEK